MKKNRLLQKAALLCAAALALPFCLGAAPESAPGGGGDTVLVEPHIMLPGPDAPTPQPLPITPAAGLGWGRAPRRGDAPAAPGMKDPSRKRTGLGLPFSFFGETLRFSPFQCILLLYVLFLVDLERMGLSMSKKVAVIMAATVTSPRCPPAIKRLKGFGIPVEVKVMSATAPPTLPRSSPARPGSRALVSSSPPRGKRPTWPACWRPTPPCRSSASR